MYSKIWVTFEGVVVGLAFYFLYAALFVPTFVMPRAARQRVSMPRPAVNTSSEVERMSRENSELLAEVFPDADDWRRIHPLSVIPKDRSWILLFPNEPRPEDGVITFDSCTFVKPSAEKNLSEKERFRRAIVVETADKVELRFNARLELQALTGGLSPNNFERGQFFGQVTVRSVMDPDDPNDDFHLTTRNISFSLEQITTDSRALKSALESYGFTVILYNEGAPTIYHWQQFKLCLLLFGERLPILPKVRICENECKNLCSAILVSPLTKKGNTIELDKSSEKKETLKRQPGLTTQLPSAMIYLLYGLYGDLAKKELSTFPDDLPDNLSL